MMKRGLGFRPPRTAEDAEGFLRGGFSAAKEETNWMLLIREA